MNGSTEGRYVYCVALGDGEAHLGKTGIDGSEVLTIPAQGLCAVVHCCSASPYSSDDEEVVRRWAVGHQNVVEAAFRRLGTVIPLRFDTIIRGTDGASAEDNVRRWLLDDAEELKGKLEYLKGKEEYGVQIFWDPATITGIICGRNEDIGRLQKEMASKSKGLAYMYRQRLEKLLKEELEREAERAYRDFYQRVKACVSRLKVEGLRSEEGREMLMNLSCLVPVGDSGGLADQLEKIDSQEGVSVRFTGPWPPYSFVTAE